MENKPEIRIYARNLRFVEPYVVRELDRFSVVWVDKAGDICDIAIVEPSEEVPVRPTTVLRCPNVIGTGMTGWPFRLAAAVYKGFYFHAGDGDVRVYAVHATDVARAVKLAFETPGEFTVTDTNGYTLADLADALSYRMKQKRVLDVPWKWLRLPARMIMKQFVPEPLPSGIGEDFARQFGFEPVNVVYYLKTHIYDDESL